MGAAIPASDLPEVAESAAVLSATDMPAIATANMAGSTLAAAHKTRLATQTLRQRLDAPCVCYCLRVNVCRAPPSLYKKLLAGKKKKTTTCQYRPTNGIAAPGGAKTLAGRL